jgi:hypothetical protein|tara:strand:- start:289 stop:609 length:321 start_codon:yes stop_codon:yes gene_type:complete
MVYVVKNKRIGIKINTPSSLEVIDFFEKTRQINSISKKKRCSINRIDEIDTKRILSNNKTIDLLPLIPFLFSRYSLKKAHPVIHNAGQSNSLRSKLSVGNDNTIRG